MGMSGRTFLLDGNDSLYLLPNARFEQMFRDPTRHRIRRFAGTRVRMADVVVEFLDRRPIRVVCTAFGILTFGGSDQPVA
jgi:hypothetical protein